MKNVSKKSVNKLNEPIRRIFFWKEALIFLRSVLSLSKKLSISLLPLLSIKKIDHFTLSQYFEAVTIIYLKNVRKKSVNKSNEPIRRKKNWNEALIFLRSVLSLFLKKNYITSPSFDQSVEINQGEMIFLSI